MITVEIVTSIVTLIYIGPVELPVTRIKMKSRDKNVKSSYQGILQRSDQINSSEQWHSHTRAGQGSNPGNWNFKPRKKKS